jgi:hypothetical protein
MKFLLDTNFLLIPGQFGVDVFSELSVFGKPELYTLKSVLSELEKLSAGRGRNGRAARIGIAMLEKNSVTMLRPRKNEATDDQIIRAARKGDFAVCTQDAALAGRLKGTGIKVVTLRHKKYLEMA